MAKTQSSPAHRKSALDSWREGWAEVDRYWFRQTSPTTMGLFRILIGTLAFINFSMIGIFFSSWFTEQGFVPQRLNNIANGPIDSTTILFGHAYTLPFTVPRINLLADVYDARITLAFYLLTLLAAVFTALGLWTRISSIALAIGVVTLQHRNILILHGGDTVLRLGVLYVAIAPSGAACSLDRLRAVWKGQQIEPRSVSIWPQRLVAFNTALIYFTTWWGKMDGNLWRNGTATWYTFRLHEFYHFPYPHFLRSAWMTPVMTYSTLTIELALGTLVFWKPARNYVILGGILLHLGIEYTMNIPLFSFLMITFYLSFIDGEEVDAWVKRMGEKYRDKKVVVHFPAGAHLVPERWRTLRCVDPFHLVEYEPNSDATWGGNVKGALGRSIGAWPLAFVPGGWRRLLQSSVDSHD